MSFTDEEIRRAAELKAWAEGRIAELENEIDKLRETLFIVDAVLRQTSFKKASNIQQPTPAQVKPAPVEEPRRVEASVVPATPKVRPSPAEEFKEVRPIKRGSDGKLLANVYISEAEAAIIPSSDVRLSSSTPPLRSFFVNRILEGMRNKDQDSLGRGTLTPEAVISYDLSEEGGLITKILIKNYRDKGRLNEIINSAAWTFTRMLEKKG